MEKDNRIFELTVCNLKSEDNAPADAVLNCVDETDFDMIVSKSGEIYNTVKVTGTVVSVSVHKKIGNHNTIKARLKIVENMDEATDTVRLNINLLKNTFMRRKIRLNVIQAGERFMVAEHYYVFGVQPSYQKMSSTYSATYYVDLVVYSWDKFLDITKQSKSYSDKRLGEDIVNGNRGIMSRYKNAPQCITSGMRVLRGKANNNEKGKEKEQERELILPFLEQHDETEYRFLLRTANQYGEFLYFENGALNLGLTRVADNDSGSTEKERVTEIDESQYASIESLSDNMNDESTIESFYKESVDVETAENTQCTPLQSNGGYSGLPITPPDDTKGKWMDELYPPAVFRVFARFFQYSTFLSFFDTNILEENSAQYYAKKSAEKFNNDVVSKYKPKGNDSNSMPENNGGNGDSASKNGQSLCMYEPDSALFVAMNKAKMNVANNQYLITFDDNQMNLGLGDIVTCEGIGDEERFVVVEIQSKYDKDDKVRPEKIVNQMKVTVIPVYEDCPIPLPIEVEETEKNVSVKVQNPVSNIEPSFRFAEVVDSEDPYRMDQVKVKYLDGDSSSSEWLKVVTPFASKGGAGIACKLNAGDKVLVLQNLKVLKTKDKTTVTEYISLVIGSVYDGDNAPPFGQRKYSTVIRSNNGHSISFLDKQEYRSSIFTNLFPGLKCLNYVPGLAYLFNDTTSNPKVLKGLGGIDISDVYGLYSISTSSDQRKISISSPFGTVDINAAMGITVSAPNGDVKIEGKNIDIVAGNNLTLKSGASLENSISGMAGSSFLKKAGMSALNTVASRVTGLVEIPALRFIVELIVKPVAGNLKIHSGRYLMLEANNSAASLPKEVKDKMKWTGRKSDAANMISKIKEWKSTLCAFKEAYTKEYKKLCSDKEQIANDISIDANSKKGIDANLIVKQLILKEKDVVASDLRECYDKEVTGEQNAEDANILFPEKVYVGNIVKKINKLRQDRENLLNKDWCPNDLKLEGDLFKLAHSILKGKQDKNFDEFRVREDNALESILFASDDDQKKALRNGVIKLFGASDSRFELKNAPAYSVVLAMHTDNWADIVDTVTPKDVPEGMTAWFKDKGFEALDKMLPLDVLNTKSWKTGATGEILISQNDGTTISIDGKQLATRNHKTESLKAFMSGLTLE